MRSRVELFEKIRKDRRREGLSIRELAERHGTHRRTVRQALADAVPPPRKAYPVRPRPAIGEWASVIDAWLIADKQAPRKQRHTARRIWQRRWATVAMQATRMCRLPSTTPYARLLRRARPPAR